MQLRPHDVGAGVGEPLAGVGHAPVLARDVGLVHRERDDRNLLRSLDDVEGDQRLLRVAERLADDEVHAGVDRPADLLLEHRAHRLVRCRVGGVVDVGVADVAGEQRAGLLRNRLREIECSPVDRLEVLLAADYAELLAMRVIRERLDDVRSRVNEVAVELRDRLRMFEHDLRHERPGLQIAAALELEDIAFGANDGAGVEALQQRGARNGGREHGGRSPGCEPRRGDYRISARKRRVANRRDLSRARHCHPALRWGAPVVVAVIGCPT
jgi:hypothetical protein